MKKYNKYMFIIILVMIFISGCIQEKSPLTGQTIKNPKKGCLYSDGSICNQICCKTGDNCSDQNYSYRKCNFLTSLWGTKKYKNQNCTGSCEIKKREDDKEKNEQKKETTDLKDCNPIECDKKDKEECHGTTKKIYDCYCDSDDLCAYTSDFEYNSIDCGYVEPPEVPTCSSGWKCKDPNYKGYQHSDCSWSTLTYCENGCEDSKCVQICTPNIFECNGKWLEKCHNDGSGWGNYEYCLYGCENEKCKLQPQICIPNEKKCFENSLQQCSSDGLKWQTIVTCEYECENKQCIQESTNQTIVSRVIDGDTIELNNGEKVRLIGINTPERDQYYYSEAKNKLKELAEGKSVTLKKDVSEIDIHNRSLRYVYVNNLFINLEMVRLGYAEAYEYLPDIKYSILLKEAENEAKENELGIWKTSEYKNCFIVSNFHYNAKGNDNYNLNDEYVILENVCSYPINMIGWTVKDETASHIYTFSSFVFEGGATFTLYTGIGTNTNSALYWGRTSGNYAAIWNNDGDTLFLRDGEGNLVLDYTY